MELRLRGLGHSYGDREVLRGIDLDVPKGQIVCIVGPSGCGKSTLLRMMGGLERPDRGDVLQVGEVPQGCLNPLTYIFQDFALLPWRSVAGNVSLVLEDHPLAKADAQAMIADVSREVGMVFPRCGFFESARIDVGGQFATQLLDFVQLPVNLLALVGQALALVVANDGGRHQLLRRLGQRGEAFNQRRVAGLEDVEFGNVRSV